ncbi:hypothetical protein MHYP_G00269020 [Metynnis hypsauchen]
MYEAKWRRQIKPQRTMQGCVHIETLECTGEKDISRILMYLALSALEAHKPTTTSIPDSVVSDADCSTAENAPSHAAPAPYGAPSTSTEDAALTTQAEQDEALLESTQLGESAIHEEPDLNLLRKHATAFVLSAREKHLLSQSAVNDIVPGVQYYQASLLV